MGYCPTCKTVLVLLCRPAQAGYSSRTPSRIRCQATVQVAMLLASLAIIVLVACSIPIAFQHTEPTDERHAA